MDQCRECRHPVEIQYRYRYNEWIRPHSYHSSISTLTGYSMPPQMWKWYPTTRQYRHSKSHPIHGNPERSNPNWCTISLPRRCCSSLYQFSPFSPLQTQPRHTIPSFCTHWPQPISCTGYVPSSYLSTPLGNPASRCQRGPNESSTREYGHCSHWRFHCNCMDQCRECRHPVEIQYRYRYNEWIRPHSYHSSISTLTGYSMPPQMWKWYPTTRQYRHSKSHPIHGNPERSNPNWCTISLPRRCCSSLNQFH